MKRNRYIIAVDVTNEHTHEQNLYLIRSNLEERVPGAAVTLYQPNDQFRPISEDNGTGWRDMEAVNR